MTKEQYNTLPLLEIKKLAKARGLKGVSTLKKEALILRMLSEDEKSLDAKKTNEEADTARNAESVEKSEDAVKNAEPAKKPEASKRTTGTKKATDERTAVPKRKTPRQRQEKPETLSNQSNAAHQQTHQPMNQQTHQQPSQSVNQQTHQQLSQSVNQQTHQQPSQPVNQQTHQQPSQSVNQQTHQQPTQSANQQSHQSGYQSNNHSYNENHTQDDGVKKEFEAIDSGSEAEGILEVMPDGYGFIRSDNFLPGENDVYVAPSQIRRFHLRTGDVIRGNTRIKTAQEKFSALLYLKMINGEKPQDCARRMAFEDMTPIFPNERIHLERPGGSIAMRITDLISPIGKGQRGMIVSPPKAGKTTLLKDAAKSILRNNPEMHLIILLIDERPEEVTDIKEAIEGKNVEVIYSTFDETPENHKRVSEMVIERAKRLVESKRDVVIFIDSITRLTRAYNQVIPPSGRTLSGGLDPAALHMPKRFFGAARNMREGGSLTILATALVETGSKMDDVVYEEFKGTGNMELVLDRKLQERRIFPAIDIVKSGTRREDLLLNREEQEAITIMRKALNGMRSDDAAEKILNVFAHTRSNREVIDSIKRHRIL